ncbi:hypothetical protein [Leucobacter massiliensis]|uniref:hypothetical protein n=1 Tax=Leucobacter massiliensis TaxID=1686285 RepID=UPI0011B284C3|nr:hypothetical protein [Leucobacter massiliensis]
MQNHFEEWLREAEARDAGRWREDGVYGTAPVTAGARENGRPRGSRIYLSCEGSSRHPHPAATVGHADLYQLGAWRTWVLFPDESVGGQIVGIDGQTGRPVNQDDVKARLAAERAAATAEKQQRKRSNELFGDPDYLSGNGTPPTVAPDPTRHVTATFACPRCTAKRRGREGERVDAALERYWQAAIEANALRSGTETERQEDISMVTSAPVRIVEAPSA